MATNSSINLGTGATGTIVQGAGVGTACVFSTATYPSTSGTNGNVLTSDGTNWVSSPSSGLGYTLQMQIQPSNPVDATTYFFRYGGLLTTSTTSGGELQQLIIPRSGTITACYGRFLLAIAGSNENTTLALRLNNTTDINVTTTAQLTANPTTFGNGSLSTAVSAGDYLEVKLICPTWATNPVSVSCSLTIYIS